MPLFLVHHFRVDHVVAARPRSFPAVAAGAGTSGSARVRAGSGRRPRLLVEELGQLVRGPGELLGRLLDALLVAFFAWRTIFSTSSLARPLEAVMVMFWVLPVARSLAETFTMPLASMSNVTSIWGTPRGAGGMPTSWNLPRVRLSRAMGRSPWSTCTSTDVWLSAAVENTSVLRVGMVVLRAIRRVQTPPRGSV